VAALNSTDLQALSSTQMKALTSATLNKLTTDQVATLLTTQVQAISTASVQGLTTTQLNALGSEQVQALNTTQVQALSSVQVRDMSSTVVQSLSSGQVKSLTSSQLNALSSISMQAIDTADVTAMTLFIKSKKNDQDGNGFRYFFTRALPGDTYCIVDTLWTYAKHAAPAKGRSLFEIPKLKWTLKPPYFAQELKKLAVQNGLDPKRVSSHSLRIGGASTLAAAGLNDHEIQGVGDWKSNTYLTYVRKNILLFEKSRRALASNSALDVTSIRRMYGTLPGEN
jgi:hypothetical protein